MNITNEELINSYLELKSSYKVAKKYNLSATAVKRVLKKLGVLRTQNVAAKERGTSPPVYKRTDEHRKKLSDLAKLRTGDKNPFHGKKHSDDFKQKLSELAKTRTEKRNPNYRHGNYERRPRDFKNSVFTPIRNFVFNRDKYTCNYCQQVGNHLHAHHRIPFWVKPEAFLDKDNLVTVCTKCHFEKAHLGNWQKFDINLITNVLIERYNIHCERLNELADLWSDVIVRTSDINKTEEESKSPEDSLLEKPSNNK